MRSSQPQPHIVLFLSYSWAMSHEDYIYKTILLILFMSWETRLGRSNGTQTANRIQNFMILKNGTRRTTIQLTAGIAISGSG